MLLTLDVVCPKCSAAKGALCTEPKRDGNFHIYEPHIERIDKAVKLNKENYEDHGNPQNVKNFFLTYFTKEFKTENGLS